MTSPFRVFLVTYNVGDTGPPDDLTRLLKLDSKELPNLYAIGLQELKHSATALLTDAIYDDPWTNALTNCLCTRNYVRIKSVRLMGLHLAVFVKRVDLAYICNVESETTPTGFNGLWGNKGGISVRMDIFGINVCFVNCHLAAHQNNIANRIQDYDMIVETQKFRDIETESILDHDYVFWMGDLNFRLDDVSKAEVEKRVDNGLLSSLWQHDQLKKLMKDQLMLVDFEEGPLCFAPTYRFNKGTNMYDTSEKQRKPGWCDRILWMVHEDAFYGCELGIQMESYHSLPDYKKSDHKPVVGDFLIKVLSYPPELPVMFEPLDTWLQSKDQTLCYTISPEYKPNSKDWIGLYRSDFKHQHDYQTYEWVSAKGERIGDGSSLYNIEFDRGYIRDLEGLFCLSYFSFKKNCIVGYSNTFRITVIDDSSSDSSDSSDNDQRRRRKTHIHRHNRVSPAPPMRVKSAATRQQSTDH